MARTETGTVHGKQNQRLNVLRQDRGSARLGRPAKDIRLGTTAIRYIYAKAMERKYNYYLQTPTTSAMRYGSEMEDTVKEMFVQKYGGEIISQPFIQYNDYLGASPDGLYLLDNQKYVVEVKCPTTFESYMARVEEEMNEKHIDFWQLQMEMLATDTSIVKYIVALPPQNIFEPEIPDITVREVLRDEMYCNAILQRAKLGNEIIDNFLSSDKNFYEIVKETVTNYQL